VRLADFIESNREAILGEWVTFARSSGPAGHAMDRVALRDHAQEMLDSIVIDLRTPQTDAQQLAKSKGEADDDAGAETAAEVHGSGRAVSGFTIGEMVAEYRALRASVIRLWTVANGSLAGGDIDDLMRFNEAIDQALAESITRYTFDIDRSKEMFVAILGHDLRSPLSSVVTASQFMLEMGDLNERDAGLTDRIVRSGTRMTQMINDLLDFTRGRLGSGVPVKRVPMDLAAVAAQAVSEMESAHPACDFRIEISGNLEGKWDGARISQMLVNLLGNAVHHGSERTPITVQLRGRDDDVVIRVHNDGPPIPPADLPSLFSPFKRLGAVTPAGDSASSHLGLGLYIVQQIVSAHGGTIDVVTEEGKGTAFTVRLPRD
jgi:signal transduction histidine kinase